MPRDEEGRSQGDQRQNIGDDPGMSRHGSEAQGGPIPESSQDVGSAAGDVDEEGKAGEAQAGGETG